MTWNKEFNDTEQFLHFQMVQYNKYKPEKSIAKFPRTSTSPVSSRPKDWKDLVSFFNFLKELSSFLEFFLNIQAI